MHLREHVGGHCCEDVVGRSQKVLWDWLCLLQATTPGAHAPEGSSHVRAASVVMVEPPPFWHKKKRNHLLSNADATHIGVASGKGGAGLMDEKMSKSLHEAAPGLIMRGGWLLCVSCCTLGLHQLSPTQPGFLVGLPQATAVSKEVMGIKGALQDHCVIVLGAAGRRLGAATMVLPVLSDPHAAGCGALCFLVHARSYSLAPCWTHCCIPCHVWIWGGTPCLSVKCLQMLMMG